MRPAARARAPSAAPGLRPSRRAPPCIAAARPATRRRQSLVAVLVTLLLLAVAAQAQERPLDPRVFDIGRELRCPTCVAESVAESNAAIAREMRALIQEQLDLGADRREVLAFFQERYGDWILLNPPLRGLNLLVWLLPAVAAVAALAVVARLVRRWRSLAEAPVTVDADELERVRAELRGQLEEDASR
jgi:cytochrome c-type biogenesis protein CcmH